jgi:glycosyltransferase involved in cell wall biosynthesis
VANPRLNIDVFAVGVTFVATDVQVHVAGLWAPLEARHNVRVRLRPPRWMPVLVRQGSSLESVQWRPLPGFGLLRRCQGLLLELKHLLELLIDYRRQRPDAIYVREAVLPAPFAAARLCHIPLLLEVNGALTEEAASHWLEARLLKPLLRWQARSATRLLPVTEQLRDYLVRQHGIAPKRISVVANGADLERFSPRPAPEAKSALGLDPELRYICWVGSPARWHAISELLNAFAVLRREDPSLRLILVTHLLRPEAQEELRNLGLEDDVIVKYVEHAQVADYLSAADVCVAPFIDMPRHQLTGLAPLKVAEYLACGRPVVATRLPGLEYIEREDLGVCYSAGDAAGLASALASILSLDEGEWQAMSMRCRAYAEAHYDWRELARQVERELFAAIGGRLQEAFEEPARER